MSLETYDLYFSGALLKTTDPAEAKHKIGAMFKLEGEKLERLFSGKQVPIKRGIDMDQAVKYRVAFRDAGALVDIVPAGQPAPDPASRPTMTPRPMAPKAAVSSAAQTASASATESTQSSLSLADGPLPTPSDMPTTPIAVPDFGLSSPQDFNLSDCTSPVESAPLPDISAMNLDEEGVTLDESPEPAPLEIDTEDLTLDAPGVTLIETEEVPSPPIDTDRLSMSEAHEGSLEGYQKPVEPAPLPDIGHLHLDEAGEKPKPQGKAQFVVADE